MNSLSLLLLLGASNGFLLAIVLVRTRRDAATRLLALLVAVVALRLMPYVLGYAGLYDAHRWLTFAPFDLSLAMGPLLWGYVVALTTGAAPLRWRRHLVAPLGQLAYLLACFALPLQAKWSWFTGPHLHRVEPALLTATLFSLGVYLHLAWRRHQGYQAWLAQNVSNRDDLRLPVVRAVLLVFAATTGVLAGFAAVGCLVAPLDYFDRFPLMAWMAALVYFLGLAGWRQASVPLPHLQPASEPDVEPAAAPPFDGDAPVPASVAEEGAGASEGSRAWTAVQAGEYLARLRAAGWWRDETLTLTKLAGHLGVSTRTLSRVLNEGLGQGFNEVVNRLRVEAVRAEVTDPSSGRDLLVIALDAGFNSKASFNRAFKAYEGCTPSELRREGRGERLNPRQTAPVAEIATHGGGG